MSSKFTFGKNKKLKSRLAIEELFRKGQTLSAGPLKAYYLSSPGEGLIQTAVGTSSRNFRKAVDRNRIKRLLRENWRKRLPVAEAAAVQAGRDLQVFLLYLGKELPDYSLLSEKMEVILKRLSKKVHENPPENP